MLYGDACTDEKLYVRGPMLGGQLQAHVRIGRLGNSQVHQVLQETFERKRLGLWLRQRLQSFVLVHTSICSFPLFLKRRKFCFSMRIKLEKKN